MKEINKKAIEIYELVLKEINGWSQNDLDELEFGDIIGDPIYVKIKNILEKKNGKKEEKE